MNRTLLVLVAIAFSSTVFAGCIGDDDVDAAIPTARVEVIKKSDDTFVFDASGSTGKGLKYDWSLGDGTTASDAKVEHTYTYGDAVYAAELLITDLNGVTDLWKQEITVGSGENDPPEAAFVPATRYLAVGEPLTVDASGTTDPQGDPIVYYWDFNFLMNEDEYLQFREDKKNDVRGDDGEGTDVSDGSNKSMSYPTLDELKGLTSGNKSPGHAHGPETPTVSLFNGRRTASEAVYTLQEGFPDATRFYVKLTAVDVKGDSVSILSEEVWPVLVVETKTKLYYDDLEMNGTFDLGSQATVTDATPDDENYADQYEWTFPIPDTIELMYVNVTWDKGAAADQLPNDIDVLVTSPNGGTRNAFFTDGKDISIEMTASDALGSGTWKVELWARQGAQIDWTATAWAKVDLDPFRDLEADYR